MKENHWRSHAHEVLKIVFAGLPDDATRAQVERAVSDAYPFGERKMHPYKIWLDEKAKWIDRRFPRETRERDRERLRAEIEARNAQSGQVTMFPVEELL